MSSAYSFHSSGGLSTHHVTVTDSTPVADFTVREMARVKTREPAVGLTGLVYDLQMLRACFLQVEEHSTVQYHAH